MTLVYVFLGGSVALFAAGLVAMRAESRPGRDRAELARLSVPLAPRREDLTAGPGSHRSDVHAADTGWIPLHHHLDVDTLRRVLLEPTAEFVAIVATSYGYSTAEREILTGHIGRTLEVVS